MPGFKNPESFESHMTRQLAKALDKVVDKIMEELIKSMKKQVYDANEPVMYPRQGENGGMLGEFEKMRKPEVNGNHVHTELYENPESLNHDADDFIHGSNYWEVSDDIREWLVEWVVLGKSGDFFGEGFWTRPRDFWTPVAKLVEEGKVDRWVRQALREQGIRLVKK